MSSIEKVSKRVHNCCTCDFWEGERTMDAGVKNIVFNTFQREMCRGGEKNGEKTTPMMRCKGWRLWKKAHRSAKNPLLDYEDRKPTSILDDLDGYTKG